MRDYDRPPYFEALVAFLADPTDERTTKQFALDNGVHEDTIYAFKRKHSTALYSAVDATRAQYIPKLRLEAYKAVFSNIKKNHLDRKLALQLTNDLIERSEVSQKLTPVERRAKIAAIMSQLSDKLTDKVIDSKDNQVVSNDDPPGSQQALG